jgi:hypothetical protein
LGFSCEGSNWLGKAQASDAPSMWRRSRAAQSGPDAEAEETLSQQLKTNLWCHEQRNGDLHNIYRTINLFLIFLF